MQDIFKKLKTEDTLTQGDAIQLLNIKLLSDDYYTIIQAANAYARKTFLNKAVIFAQIGIDALPCSVNCLFCQLGHDNYQNDQRQTLSHADIVSQAQGLACEGANEIFIMSTADIDKDFFLEAGRKVRHVLPKNMRMVANTGDFDTAYAHKLARAGFTGVYHICRLREGEDTQVSLENRIATLDAIKQARLELYYCVEPIGPEHTAEEIAKEIFRAKDYQVDVMAVMRRINFENSPMQEKGEISAARLALVCAVSVLCVRPKRAMGVHEPEIISLIAGANQIYAEAGSNPRDTSQKTELNRGFSVQKAKSMLIDAQWELG